MHFFICDFILDLIQNSIEAKAKVINLSLIENKKQINVIIKDNGIGMTKQDLLKVTDPFFTNGIKHPKRKFGLGIPFLFQSIELADGWFHIESKKNIGTKIMFSYPAYGINTPPLGDVSVLILAAMSMDADYECSATHFAKHRGINYTIKRSELLSNTGSLNDVANLILVKDFLISQEA